MTNDHTINIIRAGSDLTITIRPVASTVSTCDIVDAITAVLEGTTRKPKENVSKRWDMED